MTETYVDPLHYFDSCGPPEEEEEELDEVLEAITKVCWDQCIQANSGNRLRPDKEMLLSRLEDTIYWIKEKCPNYLDKAIEEDKEFIKEYRESCEKKRVGWLSCLTMGRVY